MRQPENHNLQRIDFLDYVRGMAAIGVMFFHYYSWVFGIQNPVGFINRIGLYAVAVFYILSGLTLYKVYIESRTFNLINLKKFYLKRFFRIYPLLWVIITIYLIFVVSNFDFKTIILNYSGLFGIIDWSHPIGTGVWSIGNELCFYILFPLFWMMINRQKPFLLIGTVFLIHLYFSFSFFDESQTLSEQWGDYINPLNQVFMFVSGIGIGHYSKRFQFRISKNLKYLVLIILLLLLAFIPVSGNQELILVTNYYRIIFTFLAVAICYVCLHLPPIESNLIHKTLKALGDASYSLYLLHPLVFNLVFNWLDGDSVRVSYKLLLSIGFTVLLSLTSFRFFEKKLVEIGNRYIKKIKN